MVEEEPEVQNMAYCPDTGSPFFSENKKSDTDPWDKLDTFPSTDNNTTRMRASLLGARQHFLGHRSPSVFRSVVHSLFNPFSFPPSVTICPAGHHDLPENTFILV